MEEKGKGSRGSVGFTVLMRNIVIHGKCFFAGENSFLSALCPSDSAYLIIIIFVSEYNE